MVIDRSKTILMRYWLNKQKQRQRESERAKRRMNKNIDQVEYSQKIKQNKRNRNFFIHKYTKITKNKKRES